MELENELERAYSGRALVQQLQQLQLTISATIPKAEYGAIFAIQIKSKVIEQAP